MPDMFHSIAYQANLEDYYYYNTWSSPEEYYAWAQPRKPVAGTIPFGQFGLKDGVYPEAMKSVMMDLPANGSVPFQYESTEAGRALAIDEIRNNPFPITEESLNNGKALYTIYCGICHGQKADGLGYLVRDDGGKYPVAPANLLTGKFVDTTAGLYMAAIMQGKNVMGSYADKLSYKESWDIIHHIRALQAEEAGMKYTVEVNTFLPAEARVASARGDESALLDHTGMNSDSDDSGSMQQ